MKQFVGVIIFVCGIYGYSFSQNIKTIVLIPFDAKMYNNQESGFMLEESDMTYEQSIQFFMTCLDEKLTLAIKDTVRFYSLLRTYTTDAYNDIDIVHQQAQYIFVDKPSTVQERQELSAIEQMRKRRTQKQPKTQENIHPHGELVSVRQDNSDKFLSAQFPDPQLFIDLIANYSAHYVLFVTQFEIVGEYSDPYAVSQKIYPRTIRVHYVIFNKNGKFLHGDIATVTFTAQENSITDICAQYMPIIAQQIVRKLP